MSAVPAFDSALALVDPEGPSSTIVDNLLSLDNNQQSLLLNDYILSLDNTQRSLLLNGNILSLDNHQRSLLFNDNILSLDNNQRSLLLNDNLLSHDNTQRSLLPNETLLSNDNTHSLISQTAIDRALLWHKRLGHPNPQVLRLLRRFDKQFQFPLTKACLDAHKACEACNRAKAQHLSYSTNTLPRATRPMELIHSDIWGPFPIPSIGGSRYFVSFIDDFTRYTFVYLMVNKSELYSKYEQFKMEATSTFRDAHIEYLHYRSPDASPDAAIQTLLSDNGAEYLRLGRDISHRDRTRIQLTNPHTPNQNPVAERRMGVIVTRARAMILHNNLPQFLWGHATL